MVKIVFLVSDNVLWIKPVRIHFNMKYKTLTIFNSETREWVFNVDDSLLQQFVNLQTIEKMEFEIQSVTDVNSNGKIKTIKPW